MPVYMAEGELDRRKQKRGRGRIRERETGKWEGSRQLSKWHPPSLSPSLLTREGALSFTIAQRRAELPTFRKNDPGRRAASSASAERPAASMVEARHRHRHRNSQYSPKKDGAIDLEGIQGIADIAGPQRGPRRPSCWSAAENALYCIQGRFRASRFHPFRFLSNILTEP